MQSTPSLLSLPIHSVKKISSGTFKNVIYKMCLEIIYLIWMNKKDLALNNLQWFYFIGYQPIYDNDR